jgi:hypothetical protein
VLRWVNGGPRVGGGNTVKTGQVGDEAAHHEYSDNGISSELVKKRCLSCLAGGLARN